MTILGWCSLKAPLGSRDNPSHSQCISFNVTFFNSSGVSGQWKEWWSSRFIKIQNPDPSHWRILIDVRLRLQKANIQREYGSRWNFSFMIAASPWQLFRKSVTPHARYTVVPPARSSMSIQRMDQRRHEPDGAPGTDLNPDTSGKTDRYRHIIGWWVRWYFLFGRKPGKNRFLWLFRFWLSFRLFSDPITKGWLWDLMLLTPFFSG